MLHPSRTFGEVEEDLQRSSTATANGSGAAGQIINGQFHTKEEIQELQRIKMVEYFDLLEIAKMANNQL